MLHTRLSELLSGLSLPLLAQFLPCSLHHFLESYTRETPYRWILVTDQRFHNLFGFLLHSGKETLEIHVLSNTIKNLPSPSPQLLLEALQESS